MELCKSQTRRLIQTLTYGHMERQDGLLHSLSLVEDSQRMQKSTSSTFLNEEPRTVVKRLSLKEVSFLIVGSHLYFTWSAGDSTGGIQKPPRKVPRTLPLAFRRPMSWILCKVPTFQGKGKGRQEEIHASRGGHGRGRGNGYSWCPWAGSVHGKCWKCNCKRVMDNLQKYIQCLQNIWNVDRYQWWE